VTLREVSPRADLAQIELLRSGGLPSAKKAPHAQFRNPKAEGISSGIGSLGCNRPGSGLRQRSWHGSSLLPYAGGGRRARSDRVCLAWPALRTCSSCSGVEKSELSAAGLPDPPRSFACRQGSAQGRHGPYRRTTGQVRVRVTPSTSWICLTTSLASISRLETSARAITS
jgi:hypothetical protein